MRIVGIDPGQSGAIAVLDECGLVRTFRFSRMDENDVWGCLSNLDDGNTSCFLEKVHATPQMGVTSAFKFGCGYKMAHCFAIAAGLDPILVTPQKWQKELGLISTGRKIGKGDTDKKNRNKAMAKELFPEVQVTHATADALLIAHYGRLQ